MTDIVEQAARVLCEANGGNPDFTPKSYVNGIATGEVHDPLWVDYVEEAQALADAGLLRDPALTVPHRDEVAAAIAQGYEPENPTPNRHDYRATDAVLELLAGQPTVAEVKAQALADAAHDDVNTDFDHHLLNWQVTEDGLLYHLACACGIRIETLPQWTTHVAETEKEL